MPEPDLVPIKVRIPLGRDGRHKFPAFNTLPPEVRDHMDWAKFFDARGIGWHYDRLSGHGKSDVNNPDVPADHPHRNDDRGLWYGGTCVPEPFATAAAAAFPEDVEVLDEASWERFYEDRAHADEADEDVNLDELQAILLREQLEERGLAPPPSAEEKQRRKDALNPAKKRAGVTKNDRKRWEDFKASRGLTIHPSKRKPTP